MKKIFVSVCLFSVILLPSSKGQSYDFLTNGLISYLPFNGNTLDASGNQNNGFGSNITYIENRFGNKDGAVSFLQTNSYVQISNSSRINNYPLTYSAWFNVQNLNIQRINNNEIKPIVGKLIAGNGSCGMLCLYSQFGYLGHYATNEFEFYTGGSGNPSGFSPLTNFWYHAVVTYDTNQVTKIYINGQLLNTVTIPNPENTDLPIVIGATLDAASKPGWSWPGYISDVRVYNRALSSNEVASLHQFESFPLWTNGFGYATNSNSVTILGYAGSNSSVMIPSSIRGLPVTSIGDNAFANQASITSVVIPNTVTNLGNETFSGCSNLTSITIPDNVVSFGTGLFNGSANAMINGSQSLISYLSENAVTLGFTGNAATSIRNGGTASGTYNWIANWLLSDRSFISSLAQKILAGANNYGLAVKQDQSLNFPSIDAQTLPPGKPISLTVTSSANQSPILLTSGNTAVARITNNILTILGAGSTTITASQAGNNLYNPASSIQPLVVTKGNQTIRLPAIPTQTYAPWKTVILRSTSSAGLTNSYLIGNEAVGSISNNVLLLLGTGTTTITATNSGNSYYAPAGAVQTLIVK